MRRGGVRRGGEGGEVDIWEEGRYIEAQHDSPINMPSCFLSLSFFLKRGRKERFT